MSHFLEIFVGCVSKSHNGRHGDEKIDSFFEIVFILGESVEHLGCSLRVASVGDFLLASCVSHEVNLSRQVILSEVLEVVSKELLFIFFWVQQIVFSGVNVASVVS